MSNIAEFKSKEVLTKENLIKHLRWLADCIEKGEEFQWEPETVLVMASSPTGLPVFHAFGDQTPVTLMGMLELTKDIVSCECFMNAEAPPEGPEV